MNVKIIYGTAWKKERTTSLVVQAVLKGFRGIDTACQPKHYREDLVGQALKTLKDEHDIRREDLYIQTKYTAPGGQDLSKPIPYDPSSSVTAQIQSSVEKSLSNLHTTYLDSYLLHSPLSSLKLTLEAWRKLVALQDSGTVRKIGVSNAYDVGLLEALESIRRVQIVQNRWFEGNGWDQDVYEYCRKNKIQYQSFWTLSGSPTLLRHSSLIALAKELKCTPEQALLAFAQYEGITPLSGTTNERHMVEDLSVEGFVISDTTTLAMEGVRKVVRGSSSLVA